MVVMMSSLVDGLNGLPAVARRRKVQPTFAEASVGSLRHPARSWRRLAEGVGSAPTSVVTDPVFETGAASLYLPAFRKMAARVGLAPTPNGLTGRRATLTPPGNGKLALPAGVAPASIRLEDERLVYFGHGSSRTGLMDWWIKGLMGRRSALRQSNNPFDH